MGKLLLGLLRLLLHRTYYSVLYILSPPTDSFSGLGWATRSQGDVARRRRRRERIRFIIPEECDLFVPGKSKKCHSSTARLLFLVKCRGNHKIKRTWLTRPGRSLGRLRASLYCSPWGRTERAVCLVVIIVEAVSELSKWDGMWMVGGRERRIGTAGWVAG